MIVIPDLFGSYQKGREDAIAANWNDLANFEKIQAAQTANDRANLQLLAEQADFNINRNVARDLGDTSRMGRNVIAAGHAGDIAQAQTNNLMRGSQHNVVLGAAQNGTLDAYHGNLFGASVDNAITNRANAQRGSMDATAQLGAFQANYPAYANMLGTVAGNNIATQTYNSNQQLGNAKLQQGAFEASTRAGTQTSQNALNFALGQAPSAQAMGRGAAAVTLDGQATTLVGNSATRSQLDFTQQQRDVTMAQNAQAKLLNLKDQLSQTKNPNIRQQLLSMIAQQEKLLQSFGGTPATFNPAQTVALLPSGEQIYVNPSEQGGVGVNAQGQVYFPMTPAEMAARANSQAMANIPQTTQPVQAQPVQAQPVQNIANPADANNAPSWLQNATAWWDNTFSGVPIASQPRVNVLF